MVLSASLYWHSKDSILIVLPLLDLAWVGSSVEGLVSNLVDFLANEIEVEPSRIRSVRVSKTQIAIQVPTDSIGLLLWRVSGWGLSIGLEKLESRVTMDG